MKTKHEQLWCSCFDFR